MGIITVDLFHIRKFNNNYIIAYIASTASLNIGTIKARI